MKNLTPQPVNVNKVPVKCAAEGPMGISIRPDFSTDSIFSFSSDGGSGPKKISQILSMYFDTIDCASIIIVTIKGSTERFKVPANSSGYLPINCSVPANIQIETQSGVADGGPSTFTFYNYEIPPTFFFNLAALHAQDEFGTADVRVDAAPATPEVLAIMQAQDTTGATDGVATVVANWWTPANPVKNQAQADISATRTGPGGIEFALVGANSFDDSGTKTTAAMEAQYGPNPTAFIHVVPKNEFVGDTPVLELRTNIRPGAALPGAPDAYLRVTVNTLHYKIPLYND